MPARNLGKKKMELFLCDVKEPGQIWTTLELRLFNTNIILCLNLV